MESLSSPSPNKEKSNWHWQNDIHDSPGAILPTYTVRSLSDDDGKHWSTPVVVARTTKKGTQLSYPYIFEVNPRELWLTTMFGNLRIKLSEKYLIAFRLLPYGQEWSHPWV